MAGFTKPTTTQTPDALFDYWLTRITGGELHVLLYAIRRTFGFKKEDDQISIEQFAHGITTRDGRVLDEGTGLTTRGVVKAISRLVDKGLLHKTRRVDSNARTDVNSYRLTIVDHRRERAEHGYRALNTTQVPDELFDYWLPRHTDGELFVLLYIIRRTLGFGKLADIIGPRQFLHGVKASDGFVLDEGCGVTNKTLYKALHGLEEKGLITITRRTSPRRGNLPSLYSLVFENEVPMILMRADPRLLSHIDLEEETAGDAARGNGIHGEHEPDTQRGGTEYTESMNRIHKGGERNTRRAGTDSGESENQLHEEREREIGRGGIDDAQGFVAPVPTQQTDDKEVSIQHSVVQDTEEQDTDESKLSKVISTDRHAVKRSARQHSAVSSRLYSGTIANCIEDWSKEFHDADRFIQNRTRAMRLWAESGLDEEVFIDVLFEARRRTKRALVTKAATDGTGTYQGNKNRMPYFFAVIQDLIDEGHGEDTEAR